jgi:hypothetical protein
VTCLETLVRTSQALEQVRDAGCRTTIYRADSPRLRYFRPRTFILINTFLPTSLLSLAARIAHANVNRVAPTGDSEVERTPGANAMDDE